MCFFQDWFDSLGSLLSFKSVAFYDLSSVFYYDFNLRFNFFFSVLDLLCLYFALSFHEDGVFSLSINKYSCLSKNKITYGGFMQTSILNYFSSSWILCNIYILYFYEIINLRENRDRNFTYVSKRIINYYDREVY